MYVMCDVAAVQKSKYQSHICWRADSFEEK